jgi:hypothetical protein
VCPELATCRDWYDNLPKDLRPTGIIAGRHHWTKRNPQDEAE